MDVGVNDFEDIAVYFSEEEWTYLGEEQKRLYREVMMENYQDLCSLGSFCLKPELISKIERGKEPCVNDRALCDGEIPIVYLIIKPDILSKLPEILHDDDESDYIYLEIDSDSETEQERESYTSDPLDVEDDDLSDGVFTDPELLSPEPRIKPNFGDAALCEDENVSECVYVLSEDETTVEPVNDTHLEEDEDEEEGEEEEDEEEEEEGEEEDEEEDDYEDDDSSSDCVYVGAETIPTTVRPKPTLVKHEEYEQEIDVEAEQIKPHSEPPKTTDSHPWEPKTLNGIDHVDDQIKPHSEPPKTTDSQPWEPKTLNGIDHDRIIEHAVRTINHTAVKKPESPNNNLLNVWYVKTVENSSTSRKEIIVPGSCVEQRKEDKSAEEGAERDQITDLEFLCPLCPQLFTNVSKFFEHQKVHEPKTPVCPECGARFSDSIALERHLLLHIEEKIQVCQECGQCFTSRSTLEAHMKTHKGDKQWTCPECGKFLYSKSGLDRHLLIHIRDKPVPCPQCGKCFIKQTNYEMHLRLHAGEDFYPCTHCEKLFSAKAACERHIRAHTMERPHGCPECGKRFLYNGCLIKHMRVHTGEKPYVCLECGRRFGQSSSLNSHRRLHEDEKPYVCPECKKCFAKKFSFEMHLKIHAKGKLLAEIAQMQAEKISNLVPAGADTTSKDSIADVSVSVKPDIDKPGDGKSFSERPLVDVSLKNGQYGDVPVNERPAFERTLNDRPVEDISLNERHVGDVTVNGGPLGVVSFNERPTLGFPFNGRPVIDVSFDSRPAGDVTFKNSVVTGVSLNSWPVEDISFIDEPFLDISSNDQSIRQNSFLQIPPRDVYYNKDIVDISHSTDSDVSFTTRPVIDVSFCNNPENYKPEEKQHVCPECGKTFPYKGCLVKHLRTHTGEKPYACTVCGKSFSQTSTLNCHKRIHTGERPYICPQCGKGFTSQSHVHRHQVIHNVNRSFLCNGCGKEFAQRTYLLKHQRRMTCPQTLL